MIAIVCGGRDFKNYELLAKKLDALKPTFVIQGGARGADLLAKRWAQERGVPCAQVDANWDYYAGGAGPRRNAWMLLLKPEAVIAFAGGTGTLNMIAQAEKAGVKVILA